MHRLEEDELFDLEDFSSRGGFPRQGAYLQLYFNLVRPNSHKEDQSLWQIIERLAHPNSDASTSRARLGLIWTSRQANQEQLSTVPSICPTLGGSAKATTPLILLISPWTSELGLPFAQFLFVGRARAFCCELSRPFGPMRRH